MRANYTISIVAVKCRENINDEFSRVLCLESRDELNCFLSERWNEEICKYFFFIFPFCRFFLLLLNHFYSNWAIDDDGDDENFCVYIFSRLRISLYFVCLSLNVNVFVIISRGGINSKWYRFLFAISVDRKIIPLLYFFPSFKDEHILQRHLCFIDNILRQIII